MPSKCARRVDRAHPFAVVGDTDQRQASILNLDGDRAGGSIDTVVDKFLDHSSRALDDLAGGNAADNLLRQNMDLPSAAGCQHGMRLLTHDDRGKRRDGKMP